MVDMSNSIKSIRCQHCGHQWSVSAELECPKCFPLNKNSQCYHVNGMPDIYHKTLLDPYTFTGTIDEIDSRLRNEVYNTTNNNPTASVCVAFICETHENQKKE